ncbi:hypothetical protein [Streptomyces sp. NBC_01276]|uniref:hypothetical protein n=1 Tax=Streptomyces sp. NBC_01276 TaxID=2903808 RepID=UPI002F908CF6
MTSPALAAAPQALGPRAPGPQPGPQADNLLDAGSLLSAFGALGVAVVLISLAPLAPLAVEVIRRRSPRTSNGGSR